MLPKINRALCIAILSNPMNYQWTVQGFGFLRMYPDPRNDAVRVNVWNSALRTEGVSDIHDHPWDLYSYVVAGALHNIRFAVSLRDHAGLNYDWMPIVPGINGGVMKDAMASGRAGSCWLEQQPPELYEAGDSYTQQAYEIHRTTYSDGAVTLNYRTNRRDDLARVFWPVGHVWGNAKPRSATEDEIINTCSSALFAMGIG